MPELFVELFSEEIPARMQARGAEDLVRVLSGALAALSPEPSGSWYGPRRIAAALRVSAAVAASSARERGPRLGAPEQALAGFLRKHGATRAELLQEGDFFVLVRQSPAEPAAAVIAAALPGLLRRFPWPKSMRWGGSPFQWVRPLRRITCLLDGVVVPFALADGEDAVHGLASDRLTEGHRFLAPGAFAIESAADWATKLADRHVLVDAATRRDRIKAELEQLAEAKGLTLVPDAALLDEVAGLVEWPAGFLGRIEAEYMDLPPEVMQVSMRVNQRYFALRDASGAAAPFFAFVANIIPTDGGAAIVAGNERVLRARFADARHFWDLDRRTKLADRVAALDGVVFHAKLGTQRARAERISKLAGEIAALIGADPARASRAGLLAKADLTSGMVGEFPELQGIMGGYYASHDGEAPEVTAAVRDQYLPKGPGDAVPAAPVSIAVALADKLDQLARFFAVGEKPTGAGDPFALRRAALGVLRLIRENQLRVSLRALLTAAGAADVTELLEFLAERLRVQLRGEGARHDVLAAVMADGGDDDIVRLLARAEALTSFLGTEVGASVLAAFRRAANILRIEERKDGEYAPTPDASRFVEAEETKLSGALAELAPEVKAALDREAYREAMAVMAQLRAPLDSFFEVVTVNAPEPELRRNRLALLSRVRHTLLQAADFSRIEG
jgi:glycyl-tRNA synthetase beta chain